MAPILIDGRGLFKLGFTAVVMTALVFFGGFFTGFQKASGFYQVASDSQSLTLPLADEAGSNDRDALVPEVAVSGENIDVDQPKQLIAKNQGDAALAQNAVIEKTALVMAKSTKKSSKKMIKEEAKTTVVSLDKIADVSNSVEKILHVVQVATPEDIEKAKFSIQVGMYGNIINAENMVKLLSVQNFNAYISNYKNKKDEIRYNVRFGYFQDKRSALSRLKEYKGLDRGDGYLVRFSAKNLVNLAKTEHSKETQPSLKEKPETEKTTDTQGELSRAEVSQMNMFNPGSADKSVASFSSPTSY